MPNKINFTENTLSNLPLPREGYTDFWDEKTPGLYIRVYPNRRKVFYFRTYVDKKSKRQALGDFPALHITEARATALSMSASAARGEAIFKTDVKAQQMTFGQLFKQYFEDYAKSRTKRWKDMEDFYRRDIGPTWESEPLADITTDRVQKWFDSIGNTRKATANRCFDIFRATINYGRRKQLFKGDNPCYGVDAHKPVQRIRFLSKEDEFIRFKAAVDNYHDPILRDFFMLCYYTCARKSNVLAMRWEQIDWTEQIWTIPITKNGLPVTVPLVTEALSLLQQRRNQVEESCPWVFPSPRGSESGHLVSPKNAFRAILKEAGLKNFRIHDLRHTGASHMVQNNISLFIVGQALGHQSMTSTKRYSHLENKNLREAMQKGLT